MKNEGKKNVEQFSCTIHQIFVIINSLSTEFLVEYANLSVTLSCVEMSAVSLASKLFLSFYPGICKYRLMNYQ